MFDFGVGELGLIAVVGLLVLGPERLPRVARTTGALLRKARQSWQSVRADIERELAAEDLKRTIGEAEDLKRSLHESVAAADPTPELNRAIEPVRSAPPDPPGSSNGGASTAPGDSHER